MELSIRTVIMLVQRVKNTDAPTYWTSGAVLQWEEPELWGQRDLRSKYPGSPQAYVTCPHLVTPSKAVSWKEIQWPSRKTLYAVSPTWVLGKKRWFPTTSEKCLKIIFSPSWCGSVNWVPVRVLKNRRFNSWSGHVPGLRARSPVGDIVRGNWSMFLPLSFSLLFTLSKNKH